MSDRAFQVKDEDMATLQLQMPELFARIRPHRCNLRRNIELALVLAASIGPVFVLASKINADEFAKAGAGTVAGVVVIGLARAVLMVYERWKSKNME